MAGACTECRFSFFGSCEPFNITEITYTAYLIRLVAFVPLWFTEFYLTRITSTKILRVIWWITKRSVPIRDSAINVRVIVILIPLTITNNPHILVVSTAIWKMLNVISLLNTREVVISTETHMCPLQSSTRTKYIRTHFVWICIVESQLLTNLEAKGRKIEIINWVVNPYFFFFFFKIMSFFFFFF